MNVSVNSDSSNLIRKPLLSFWQIWNMNVGFFGIQYSFGLQQTAVNPIFSFLGAHAHDLPLLNLAGPMTGLLIQPIIGALSDKTWSPKWGRRKPFFLIGAIFCSLCLFLFPFSSALWMAVGLYWVLDAANNTAMEPYRAFIGDKLPSEQHTFGFQMQSLFVGAGITIANLSLFVFQNFFSEPATTAAICQTDYTNSIPTWVYYSFFIGAFCSITSVLWSMFKTPEIPPSEEELKEIQAFNHNKPHPFFQMIFVLFSLTSVPILFWWFLRNSMSTNMLCILLFPISLLWVIILFKIVKQKTKNGYIIILADILSPLIEIVEAIIKMPKLLWQLGLVYMFQWYALFCYWQFITPAIKRTLYKVSAADEEKSSQLLAACKKGISLSSADMNFLKHISSLTQEAVGHTGLMNGTYNFVTMLIALALVPLARKYSSKIIHTFCLLFTAFALLMIPQIENKYMLFIPMVFFGIGWASMMGLPYSMVSSVIPTDKRGVYMGIINMMIVVPMLIQTITFGPILKYVLNDNPINAIYVAGILFILASISVLFMKVKKENH